MSYTYLLVNLRRPLESFFKVEREDISSDGFDVEKIRNQFSELYPEIIWTYDGNNTYSCSTPCCSERGIEARLVIDDQPFLAVSHTWPEDVMTLASRLGLIAFDVQTGECLYAPPC